MCVCVCVYVYLCMYVCVCMFMYVCVCMYIYICMCIYGPGSSVGIATDYGMDGPGIKSQWDEILHPSRPAHGPAHPSVQCVLGLSRG